MCNKIPDWLSYHIHLPWTGNEFLAEFLPPLIALLKNNGQIKRFFFIRYIEETYHLRLRLKTTTLSKPEVIEKFLENTVQKFCSAYKIPTALIQIKTSPYSRELHYFGENLKSVYSELINEQTSDLSMQMLALKNETKQTFLLKTIATIHLIFVLSSLNNHDFKESVSESYKFAENNRTTASLSETFPTRLSENFKDSVIIAVERTSDIFASNKTIKKLTALIKKAKKIPDGRFVATHAIHLYCNKLGLSMYQESEIYDSIKILPNRFEL
jgi:thiopeptide-type bacteriocin biosynthesis protein